MEQVPEDPFAAPPRGTAIPKGVGVNSSERKLAELCSHTFLGLWCWPNVYKDDREKREICDLLVVFGRHVLIFSDKSSVFPDTGKPDVDWSRWFRSTVQEGSKQAWGAEKWIRAHPERIFTDPLCQSRLPIAIALNEETAFHRVVVARGATKRIAREFGDSSSLLIDSGLVGDDHLPGAGGFRPFTIGNVDPAREFVHVFDESTVELLLSTLDTASDLIGYLVARQALFETPPRVVACGEEDLLARYLRGLDRDGNHSFRIPGNCDAWFLDQGGWRGFASHPERLSQLRANKISYVWDDLIEEFNKHQLQGTALGGRDVAEIEVALRVMASECRTRRRLLATGLKGALTAGDNASKMLRRCLGEPGEPAYIFLTLKHPAEISDEDYRAARRKLLVAGVLSTRVEFAPQASCVIGIATEPLGAQDRRSEDLVYIDQRVDDEMRAAVSHNKEELLKFEKTTVSRRVEVHEDEYPLKRQMALKKGRNRNLLCTCGSGWKTKRCCGARSGGWVRWPSPGCDVTRPSR